MPASKQSKLDIIDRLLATHGKAQKLALILKFAGQAAKAKEVEERNARLSKKIDILLAKAMRDWNTSAATHIEGIKAANAKLQANIADIKKKIRVAQNVVKALGHLDKAIEIAGKVALAVA